MKKSFGRDSAPFRDTAPRVVRARTRKPGRLPAFWRGRSERGASEETGLESRLEALLQQAVGRWLDARHRRPTPGAWFPGSADRTQHGRSPSWADPRRQAVGLPGRTGAPWEVSAAQAPARVQRVERAQVGSELSEWGSASRAVTSGVRRRMQTTCRQAQCVLSQTAGRRSISRQTASLTGV